MSDVLKYLFLAAAFLALVLLQFNTSFNFFLFSILLRVITVSGMHIQLFQKTLSKESKHPISQDPKVVWVVSNRSLLHND